jgi:protein-S-isoprenylcysteine O-methyltransferase Ste14
MSLKITNSEQPRKTSFMPVWIALPLALLVWEGIPWAISFLALRYGWSEGRPSLWNLLGLLPVLIGTAGLIWGVILHSTQTAKGIEWQVDKSYLLKGGLYNVSRNPMYLSELTLLFGWIIFYGSISILIAFLVWYVFFEYYAVPQEERVLEAHFGEAYLEYKNRVPRWFGKVRH